MGEGGGEKVKYRTLYVHYCSQRCWAVPVLSLNNGYGSFFDRDAGKFYVTGRYYQREGFSNGGEFVTLCGFFCKEIL